MPWRPGLSTAGQETTMPESELRVARNVGTDLDGMLRKRPGITQWGQTIKSPDVGATDSTQTDFQSFISTNTLTQNDASSGLITDTTANGVLTTSVPAGDSNKTFTESRVVTLSANTKWSLRFMFRGTNLPAYGSTTNANSFVVRAQGASGSGKEFGIWSGGLYYKQASDNKYVLIDGSEFVGVGSWHSIEIQCTVGGSTLVYVDEVLLSTLTTSTLDTASFTTANSAYELEWEVEGTAAAGTQYTTYISGLQYNDTATDPFTADTIVALQDFQYVTNSGAKVRVLLAAAGNYIYHDKNLDRAWRPLHPKQRSQVYFAPYRSTVCWSDNNGATQVSVWQWDGIAAPTLLDDAPPVRYLTEHQKRLCGWGDIANPRRFYYSGDRLPNVWFSPTPTNTEDEFDTLIDAGYIEIDSRGVEVRAALGDFYGLAVLAGKEGFWKLAGNGPFSYQLSGLKVGTGISNARSFTQVGNDAWGIGTQGLVSLAATDQFGDLQANFPSLPIQDLWAPSDSSPNTINQTYIGESRLVHSPRSTAVYIAVPLAGDQSAQNIYVFNTTTQKFYGPWEIDAQALVVAEVASPVTEVVMVGGSSGQVGYLNALTLSDYTSSAIDFEMQTSAMNGRSLNPAYISLQKTWKTLRLFLLPRGHWEYAVTWWTDEDIVSGTTTRQQNMYTVPMYVIDKDLKLDIEPSNLLRTGGELMVAEIPLDKRGRSLTVSITQSTLDEDFLIQGMEIEGTVNGYEAES